MRRRTGQRRQIRLDDEARAVRRVLLARQGLVHVVTVAPRKGVSDHQRGRGSEHANAAAMSAARLILFILLFAFPS
jgi:hypothetical protein